MKRALPLERMPSEVLPFSSSSRNDRKNSVSFDKTRMFVQRARSTIQPKNTLDLLVESIKIDIKFLSSVGKESFFSSSDSFPHLTFSKASCR